VGQCTGAEYWWLLDGAELHCGPGNGYSVKAVRSSVCSRVLRQRRCLQISHGTAFTLRTLYNTVLCYKPHSRTVNSYTCVRVLLEC